MKIFSGGINCGAMLVPSLVFSPAKIFCNSGRFFLLEVGCGHTKEMLPTSVLAWRNGTAGQPPHCDGTAQVNHGGYDQ